MPAKGLIRNGASYIRHGVSSPSQVYAQGVVHSSRGRSGWQREVGPTVSVAVVNDFHLYFLSTWMQTETSETKIIT